MKRYMLSDGVLVEDPNGGLAEYDDVINKFSPAHLCFTGTWSQRNQRETFGTRYRIPKDSGRHQSQPNKEVAMQHYVVGFVFDRHFKSVLLIHKQKPEWQAGKLNGPGGEVEKDEDFVTTMVREFQEETGMTVPGHMWHEYCTIHARDGVVHFFTTYVNFNSKIIPTQQEVEKIVWKHYDPLAANVIDNLKWLIPMALAGIPVVANVNENPGNCCSCKTNPNYRG